MKYTAVIFDLFGTLVDNFEARRFEDLLRDTRLTLGIDSDAFWRTWDSEEYSRRRTRGDFATFEDCLREVCRVVGVAYDPKVVPAVVELRRQVARRNMAPRPDTIRTLSTLRESGLRIGLISDCTWQVVEVWPETPMAGLVGTAVFSCQVRLKKPDVRIYALACERLGVTPAECLYVGDCGSDELAGAVRAGMDAVHICVPYEQDLVMCRPEAKAWPGPRISSLAEVMGLVRGEELGARNGKDM